MRSVECAPEIDDEVVDILESDVLGVGNAARGKHDVARTNVLAISQRHPHTISGADNLLHIHASADVDALPFHFGREMPAQIIVKAAQDLFAAMDQDCFDAETIENAGKLNGNITATHNHDAARQVLKMEGLV